MTCCVTVCAGSGYMRLSYLGFTEIKYVGLQKSSNLGPLFFWVFFGFTSSSPFEMPITCMLDLSILPHGSLKLLLFLQFCVSKLGLNRFYWYVFKLSHVSFILSNNPLLILCSKLFLSGIFFISRSSTGFFIDSFHFSHHILFFL